MPEPISTIGIDLAKRVFQFCAVNQRGKVIYNKLVKRADVARLMATTPPCQVVMEACATSNYWTRVFTKQGHEVKLIHPAYVRPFVQTNKNDAADAQALCEAVSRPMMRFVKPKSIEQQDIQLLHRMRQRLVRQRTALSNQTRGLLGEYGLEFPIGIHVLRKVLPEVLEDASNELTPLARRAFAQHYEELIDLTDRIDEIKAQLTQCCEASPTCTTLIDVPGVGPLVATALVATMGDPNNYRNGREFSAFLGLVPRQYSSGGKAILRGISKRGDASMRNLLVQGAHAALRHMHKRDDRLSRWACDLKARKGTALAVVALANKLARICWALLAHQQAYKPQTI